MEGKDLRVNVDKTKVMQLLFGKKSSASKVVSVVSRLVVILFSVRNVRDEFIVVLMCLDR